MAAKASPKPLRVAVVDHDPAFRGTLRCMLENLPGLQWQAEFPSADQAIEDLCRLRPDLAILDVVMPGMTGFELARRLRQRLPDTKFIVVTHISDPAAVLEVRNLGGQALVLKPFRSVTFQAAIRAALAGHFYVPEQMLTGTTNSAYPVAPSILFPSFLTRHAWAKWQANETVPGFWFKLAQSSSFRAYRLAKLFGQSVPELERDWPYMWHGQLPKAWLRAAQMEYLRLLVTDRPLTDTMCTQVCISEPHNARHAFKRYFGETVGAYLRRLPPYRRNRLPGDRTRISF